MATNVNTGASAKKRIGELLLDSGIITKEQLDSALSEQKDTGKKIGSILIDKGFISKEDLAGFLEKQLGYPYCDLSNVIIDANVIKTIPVDVCRKYKLIPFGQNNDMLSIAMVNPMDLYAIDDIKFMTNCDVKPFVANEKEILTAIDQNYGLPDTMRDIVKGMKKDEIEVVEEEEDMDLTKLQAMAEDAPVIKIVNVMLANAIKERASDVHIEIFERGMRLRYRIDGVMSERTAPPKQLHAAIVSRIKIMSKTMKIDERRVPQDGRSFIKYEGRDIDLRISSIPTVHGEKIVMRILDKTVMKADLTGVGFEFDQTEIFRRAISKPHGIILITGPTGSGKTTTINASMSELNTVEVNICTIEDPVEYEIPGVNQVHERAEIGLTFASALRHFLRQDPDIIMLGEIRDSETAEMAIRSSLTGHLVISTIHTNDAPSTITRLVDQGTKPFLVTACVILIMAQRLVRTLCPKCKEEYSPSETELEEIKRFAALPSENIKLFRPKGCDTCNGGGFKGRTAICEVMEMNDRIRELTMEDAPPHVIRKVARECGMKTLVESGVAKVLRGITTMDEVLFEAMEEVVSYKT